MNHLVTFRNALLLGAAAIALVASTYKLTEAPAVWYDEGYYTQMAKNLAETGRQVLQTAPGEYASSSYVTVGYPLTIPIALSYTLFGTGVLQGRAVMALFIVAFILASYLLTRKLFGEWPAAYTALLLATFPMLYGNGKSVLGEVPGLFFLMLTLLALWHLERHQYRGWHRYLLVGIAAGVCAATKMFFVLLLAALAITYLLRMRSIKLTWSGFMVGSIGALVPLALWAYMQFGSEASLDSVLSYYTNPYAVENLPLHILHNAKRFITETTPLFTLVLMVTWGAALIMRKKREHLYSAELAAFVFCTLVLLSYVRLEGWYRYLFPATAVALIFFPAALITIGKSISGVLPRMSPVFVQRMVYAAVLLLCAGQLYQTARTSFVAQYYTATRTSDLLQAFETLSPQTRVFLYNTPEVAIMLPTKNYYQYLKPLPEITIGEKSLEALRVGTPDIVVLVSTIYAPQDSLFAHYTPLQTVDRYTVLQKK